MSNPVCTLAVLSNDSAIYRRGMLNEKAQKALLIQAMLIELAAIGGTDYTSNHAQLAIDAATTEVGTTPDNRRAARISLAFTNATAAGGSVPATLDLQMATLGRQLYRSLDLLDRMELYVICQLGFHKTRPQ